MMTLQQVYDKAVGSILAQGTPSVCFESLNCAYRGDDGLKCVVGHTILDEQYDPGMEGLCNEELFEKFPYAMEKSEVPIQAKNLLTDAQYIHDARPTSAWPFEFKDLGEHYHLDTSICKPYINGVSSGWFL